MRPLENNNPGRGHGGPRYPGTFLLAVREALLQLNWRPCTWKPTSVECFDARDQRQYLALDNLYRRLRREPRGTWPRMLVELLEAVPPTPEQTPERLAEVEGQLLVRLGPAMRPENPENDVWQQPLVDGLLVVMLVIDYPTRMSYVTQKMVEDSGQVGSYWLERGLQNLRSRSSPTGLHLVNPEIGIFQGKFGDAYDSSRALLLDELLPGQEDAGFFVIVPVRDYLWVVPINPRTIVLAPWLHEIAVKTYRDLPYPVSPEVYWLRGGLWYHFGIEIQGENVVVEMPAAFEEVFTRLRSDQPEQN